MNEENAPVVLTVNAALLRTTGGILATWAAVGVLLFGAASRLDWPLGWLFFAVWGVLKLAFILILRWHDPALLVERSTRHPNRQSYERQVLPAYFLFSFGTILLSGLDGGRFLWSGEMPPWLIIAAYVIYLLGNGLASWAAAANPFFSSESRLQAERGQNVTRRGPYCFVRHPAYLAAILIWPVTGLLLSSWWAVIPGLLAAATMLLRTVYEDRMLMDKLTDYRDYARQVRWRLLPGIW